MQVWQQHTFSIRGTRQAFCCSSISCDAVVDMCPDMLLQQVHHLRCAFSVLLVSVSLWIIWCDLVVSIIPCCNVSGSSRQSSSQMPSSASVVLVQRSSCPCQHLQRSSSARPIRWNGLWQPHYRSSYILQELRLQQAYLRIQQNNGCRQRPHGCRGMTIIIVPLALQLCSSCYHNSVAVFSLCLRL